MAKKEIDITKHVLVPKHEILKETEKKVLFDQYMITIRELPLISMKDPALSGLKVQLGDIVKITRPSKTAGESVFYRRVVK